MAANNTADGLPYLQPPFLLSENSRVIFYTLVSIVLAYFLFVNTSRRKSTLPYVNYYKSHWTYAESRTQFQHNAKRLISEGFGKFSGPFNIITGTGPITILPPEYIEAVNEEPNLDFQKYNDEEFLTSLDTFQSFRPGQQQHLWHDVLLKSLTRRLPKFTKALSDEMSSCLDKTWGDSIEWHQVTVRRDVLQWVARLSARVFLGELAENKEWLQLSINYTVNAFRAIEKLKYSYPKFLIPIADKFLPICRQVRADRAAYLKILQPILDRRNEEIRAAEQEGRKPVLPDDSIEWFRDASKGNPYDVLNSQIALSVAAIHTTSDLLTQALLNLCTHPELVEPLRNEAIDVLKRFGWKKVALTELRLLDSLFKETQRLKPVNMTSMHRLAVTDVELPGGVAIHKGERMSISSHRMWSEKNYEHADAFDGYRFFNRRKTPGLETRSLLVTTSNDHTAFGHGKHACPGRFFAANEVKIAMVHLLLKYDLRLDDPESAKWLESGARMMASYTATLHVRRRKEEINLDEVIVE